MGYDVVRFQGEVDEDLLCPICSGVLEEPVQAHFALPRLEAEGAALGAEQQHALRQAQAVLWRRGDVTERLGSAPVARGDSESLLLHLIVQVHKNKMIRLGSSTAT
jgi:hypothetical protein